MSRRTKPASIPRFTGLEPLEARVLLSAVPGAGADASVNSASAAAPAVVARQIFYNNSSFDGNDAAANASDDAAIAADKQALLPGHTATFANYTSYSNGINGLMVDIQGLADPANLSASDFVLKAGNSSDPSTWTNAPTPTSVTVRQGAGVDGSDRVEITFADGAITNQWLQVTVKADAHTGLPQYDVFYFGNAIGESGNSTTDAQVNATDEIAARNHPAFFLNPATVTNPYDYNRDGKVDATDEIIARNHQTFFLNSLKLITPAASSQVAVYDGQTQLTDGQATPVSFGVIAQEGSPAAKTFTVTNTGSSPLILGAVAAPAGFSVTGDLNTAVAPGSSTTFTIQLDLAAAGTFTGNVTFTTNDPAHDPFTLPVTGQVVKTTGLAYVFPNGVMNWNTMTFNQPVQVTLHDLGQYDSHGNLIGSNNGLLTGKYASTNIESIDEYDTSYGLSNVPELTSSSNDFRVDYTGATHNDPRQAILWASEAQAYYYIDDYRRRFLNNSFIDSLNLPAQIKQNVENLQYRPDFQSSPAATLAKPKLQAIEEITPQADRVFPAPNVEDVDVRTRANISNYASLPPLSFAFDAGGTVGDYSALVQQWIVGFNTGFPNSAFYGENSGWQTDVLPPLNDGVSLWAAYRYTGQNEVYKYLSYAIRTAAGANCGGTFIPCNKGNNLRNVLMYDKSATTAYGSGVFPYDGLPQGVSTADGPSDSDRAAMFFGGLFWDVANDAGLGVYKTSQLVWKTLSLITNGTTFSMTDFGATLQQAARDLWPDANHPGKSLYETEIANVLTSRGIPVNGVSDFRDNLPAAIGPVANHSTGFGSKSVPAPQPVDAYGSSNPALFTSVCHFLQP